MYQECVCVCVHYILPGDVASVKSGNQKRRTLMRGGNRVSEKEKKKKKNSRVLHFLCVFSINILIIWNRTHKTQFYFILFIYLRAIV